LRDLATTVDPSVPRPSACPGLLRIVQALDGGICRVKLAGGVLSSKQARAIAEAAACCASGVLELTNRSNLQIRGVLPGQQVELIERLYAAHLGPSNPAADDVRNLQLSPAAGLDPHALLDTRPLASALLDLLQNTPTLHALSAKFAIQLDGGEALAMLEHPHDIWLSALPGSNARAVARSALVCDSSLHTTYAAPASSPTNSADSVVRRARLFMNASHGSCRKATITDTL
jgi:precorrin-3B synthase